jgi:hypothetical protein
VVSELREDVGRELDAGGHRLLDVSDEEAFLVKEEGRKVKNKSCS